MIDTAHVAFGSIELNATSTMVAHGSADILKTTVSAEPSPMPFTMIASGRIVFIQKTSFAVAVHDVYGRLISTHSISDKNWTIPKLTRGIYFVTVKTAKRSFQYKFVNL
jgi:hypothetical protein